MSAQYDDIAGAYDSLHKDEQLRKISIIKAELNVQKEDSLLDVGCGTGLSFDALGCRCTGIEPSEEMIKHSSSKGHMVKGHAEKLPFPNEAFDIVISVTAIHNFSDIKKGLLEMKRVGRSRFAFSVLKKSSRFDLIKDMIKNEFTIKKVIDESNDMIFILEK